MWWFYPHLELWFFIAVTFSWFAIFDKIYLNHDFHSQASAHGARKPRKLLLWQLLLSIKTASEPTSSSNTYWNTRLLSIYLTKRGQRLKIFTCELKKLASHQPTRVSDHGHRDWGYQGGHRDHPWHWGGCHRQLHLQGIQIITSIYLQCSLEAFLQVVSISVHHGKCPGSGKPVLWWPSGLWRSE